MRKKANLLWIAIAILSAEFQVFGASPALSKPKPIQVYEKEDSNTSFTDTVRILREEEGNLEVNFEKHQGLFSVKKTNDLLRDLRRSQKSKTPVSVTVDEQDRILSVEIKEKAPADKNLGL